MATYIFCKKKCQMISPPYNPPPRKWSSADQIMFSRGILFGGVFFEVRFASPVWGTYRPPVLWRPETNPRNDERLQELCELATGTPLWKEGGNVAGGAAASHPSHVLHPNGPQKGRRSGVTAPLRPLFRSSPPSPPPSLPAHLWPPPAFAPSPPRAHWGQGFP